MKFSEAPSKVRRKGRWLLILFFISAALLLFFSELVEQSMFIDGVWYAVISRNLAEGIGTFWFPQFSATIFPDFHEHPPFIFGVQSLFFGLLGDHWLTERLFSLSHYLASGLMIFLLWRKATQSIPKLKAWWIIPLLLWQVNLVTYYFQPANLLDASVSVLGMLTIWCMWNAFDSRKALSWLLAAGVILSLGFLSKGVVSLFPLAFIVLYGIIKKEGRMGKLVGYTSLVVLSLVLFFALLINLSPLAYESLSEYLDVQLLASLKGERRLYYYRTNRFYIFFQLIWALVPMFLLLLASWGIVKWGKLEDQALKKERVKTYSNALLFGAIGLSASLPIMISPRQAIPYLLPAIPYFSLAFGLLTAPLLIRILSQWQDAWRRSFTGMIGVGYLFIIVGLGICLLKVGARNGRDAAVIQDAALIGDTVGDQTIISSTTYNMYISGYLMRYDKVSIDTTGMLHRYLLSKKDENINDSQYVKLPLPTKEYDLYQRVEEEVSLTQHSKK